MNTDRSAMKLSDRAKKTYWILTAVLTVLYAGFMLYVCINTSALVPDERWFLGILNSEITLDKPSDVLSVPNHLAYGAIYWIVMKLLGTFLRMRLLMFVMLLGVLLCVILTNVRLGQSARGVFFSCLLYLSCPMAWFTGKIIGPEIMGMCLGSWGGVFFADRVCGFWAFQKGKAGCRGLSDGALRRR